MENRYFEIFEKYGAALAGLYPGQLEEIFAALDHYDRTGEILWIADCYARFAFRMLICDIRHGERTAHE